MLQYTTASFYFEADQSSFTPFILRREIVHRVLEVLYTAPLPVYHTHRASAEVASHRFDIDMSAQMSPEQPNNLVLAESFWPNIWVVHAGCELL